jgi:hypothetical protein
MTDFTREPRQYEDPSQLVFPPELLAKAISAKPCRHPRTARRVGPRIPARYGSWATEMCSRCMSWRYDRGGCKGDRFWRGLDEMVRLLHREDED